MNYVSDRKSFLIDRNFRLLATWSQVISKTFKAYVDSVEYKKRNDTLDMDPKEVKLGYSKFLLAGMDVEVESGFENYQKKRWEGKKANKELIKKIQKYRNEFIPQNRAELNRQNRAELMRDIEAEPYLTNCSHSDTGKNKDLYYYAKFSISQKSKNSKENILEVFCDFDLEKLFNGIDSQLAFHDLFLVNPEGKVIYQKEGSQLRFDSFERLLNQREAPSWLDSLFGTMSIQEKRDSKSSEGKKDDEGQIGFDRLKRNEWPVPGHIKIALGGTSYQVFTQSVRLPIQAKYGSPIEGGDPHLHSYFLCGIVSNSDFQKDYLAIPFTGLLILVFILFAILLSLPLIRIILVDPRERVTWFTVVSMSLASVIGTAVLTFFLCDVFVYHQTKDALTKQLMKTAASIHEAFHAELKTILEVLDSYDSTDSIKEDLKFVQNNDNERGGKWRARNVIVCPGNDGGWVDFADDDCRYPNSIVVFWVDSMGNGRINWTKELNPNFIGIHDLNHRDYVSNVIKPNGTLYSLRLNEGKKKVEFFIDPIISLTGSKKTVVVSIPSMVEGQNKPWVAAIETELQSLMKFPVLPAESGFAVVENSTGDVLFHSKPNRGFKREKFFKETDMNPELEALVYARTSGCIEGDYWGNGHQFCVQPILNLPWTLIVYQEKHAIRGFNFEALFFSGSLYALYFVIILSSILLFWAGSRMVVWVVGDGKRDIFSLLFLWPSQQCQSIYVKTASVNVLIFLLVLLLWPEKSIGGLSVLEEGFVWLWLASIISILFPLLLFGLKRENLSQTGVGISAQQSDSSPPFFTYICMGISFLMTLAILPATLFFSSAYEEELKRWAMHNLYELSSGLVGYQQQQTVEFRRPHSGSKIPGSTMVFATSSLASHEHYPMSECDAYEDSDYRAQRIYKEFLFPTTLCFSAYNPSYQDEQESYEQEPLTIFEKIYYQVRANTLTRGPLYQRGPLIETWGFTDRVTDWSLKPERLTETREFTDRAHERKINWTYGINPKDSEKKRWIGLNVAIFPSGDMQKGGAAEDSWLHLESQLPTQAGLMFGWSGPLSPWKTWWWYFFFVPYFAIVCSLPYFVIRKIFPSPYQGSDFESLKLDVNSMGALEERNLLILGPPGSGKSEFLASLQDKYPWGKSDCHTIQGDAAWAIKELRRLQSSKGPILLDHFEYEFGDPKCDQQKQELIEGLLFGKEPRTLYVLSAINPLSDKGVSQQGPLTSNNQEGESSGLNYQWGALFGSFTLLYYRNVSQGNSNARVEGEPQPQPQGSSPGPSGKEKNPYLEDEIKADRHLQNLGQWIQTQKGWESWTSEQVVTRLLGLARPHYQNIWHSCSKEEKLALYHLAIDRMLHTDNPELPRLYLKGLVQSCPNLKLMNRSFRRFILIAGKRESLDVWKSGGAKSVWELSRLPLLIMVGGGLVFLFATQQEFKTSLAALVSILPLLFPAIPELPGFLMQSQNGGKSD